MTMEQNAQPIRVAQMMTDMNYGGVEMVVMNYYRHMDRSRVQFDFFALEGSTLPQREEIERLGGRVYVVPKYTHLLQYEQEIGRLFRQNGYQIVHSHMNTLSVLSLWGAKRAGVPNRIAHNHSTVGRGEGAKNVMKYLLRPFATVYPTRLCACSRTAGSWLYGEKPFRVFNNAIELDRFTYDAAKRKAVRQELGLEDELVLGHVGRFCYAKNHEFLLDVMAEVCKQRPDAVLLLIGEGESEAAARRKAEALGLQENVRFLGRQSDPAKFYQAMDAFVLPSRYEGLGIVLIEAQAAALPVICSTEVAEPDANIDFRRVRNLNIFFSHTAVALTTDVSEIEAWQGGDIVIFERHIGIVSDRRNKNGVPYIIHHNDPWQMAYEQDILEKRTDIVGHYRISK